MPQIANKLIKGAKGVAYSIITPTQLRSKNSKIVSPFAPKIEINVLFKLYLKLMSSEALVRQDLEGPGNVKGARDHSFLHVPEHRITSATSNQLA